MISFRNDYSEGAHPKIFEALAKTNFIATSGYGEDEYCRRAAALIQEKFACADADIHFTVGGTQTNLITIACALRPHEGVVSAVSGHISVHESGAIEATGHKVLTLAAEDGKLTAAQIAAYLESVESDATKEHMVKPAMVYISQTTECGTVYTKGELAAISEVCRNYGVYLYIDGARLAYALADPANELTMADYAKYCDAFYVGGTKAGTLFGEALVLTNNNLKRDFRYILKQRGGLLAKGRLLGVQFEALFQDSLYTDIGAHANSLAQQIKKAFADKGFELLFDSASNQQFPILPPYVMEQLKKSYIFEDWAPAANNCRAVRFCTSWATKPGDVASLCKDIASL